MTKEEYESQVLLLIGLRIADVRYHEMLYTDESGAPTAEPGWNKNPAFDSLDYGVDLDFDDGSIAISLGEPSLNITASVSSRRHNTSGRSDSGQ